MNLLEVNALTLEQFVARFGGVFEHSPWVAERAWNQRPFSSVESIFQAMVAAVRHATPAEHLALICAHPELAGREAGAGALTADSTGEQGRLGFLDLQKGEWLRTGELNGRYREKFGFPCIVALKLHASRASVMAEMERRLANDAGTERENALQQITHISRGRLEKLLSA